MSFLYLFFYCFNFVLMQMLQFSTLFHSHFSLFLFFVFHSIGLQPQWRKLDVCTEPQKPGQHKCTTSESKHNFHLHTYINVRTHTRVCVRPLTEVHIIISAQKQKQIPNPNTNQLQISDCKENNKRERRQCQKHQHEIEAAVYSIPSFSWSIYFWYVNSIFLRIHWTNRICNGSFL